MKKKLQKQREIREGVNKTQTIQKTAQNMGRAKMNYLVPIFTSVAFWTGSMFLSQFSGIEIEAPKI